MRPARWPFVWILPALLAGCEARRAAPPPRPVVATTPADLESVNLYLRSFEVEGLGKRATQLDIDRLQDALLDYVEGDTRLGSVQFNLSGRRQPEEPALDLHISMKLDQETERTWVLDAANVLFLGSLPLVPWWGDVFLTLQARVVRPSGKLVTEYDYEIQSPFSAMAFAWYRRGYIERAYQRAYQEAFRRLAADIAADAPALTVAAKEITPTEPGAIAPLPEESTTDDEMAAIEEIGDERATDPWGGVVVLEPDGFHVIREYEIPEPEAGVWGVLKLLGGVEASIFGGLAHVSSQANDDNGSSITVASGDAEQSGYRISLYSAPESTGWFWYPTVGYLQQRIGNIDIASSLATLNRLDDPNDIAAIASDPATGQATDPGSANVYILDMRSGYAGGRIGLDVVGGNQTVVFFASATLGLNLVEYRQIRARLQGCGAGVDPETCNTERSAFELLSSGAIGGTIGLKFPEIHLAVRLVFDYERFRDFRYEHPLEVRGPARYDPDKDIFEHPRMTMESASLWTWNGQLAAAFVF
jgi:hypothetical protein